MLGGASDQAQAQGWAGQRSTTKSAYNGAGINLAVPGFGFTDQPATDGADPAATAQVKQHDLDGVNVDLEALTVFETRTGSAEQWLVSFAVVLRVPLPSGQYLTSHARQGATKYTDCPGPLNASSSAWPNTALFQTIASGVDSRTLLVGKLGTNGHLDPGHTCHSPSEGKVSV